MSFLYSPNQWRIQGGGGAESAAAPLFSADFCFLADFCYFRARHRGIWIPRRPPPPPPLFTDPGSASAINVRCRYTSHIHTDTHTHTHTRTHAHHTYSCMCVEWGPRIYFLSPKWGRVCRVLHPKICF